ncbi:glucose-6-phosphate isomerase [Yoonia sp.]|jgi:outer membrane lipoprotein SlyB|uniref:glucose-6-phosphate isomerase n=1 Tax=Yoonia sp. TaxID=2212373 RepID=UPI0025D1A9F9|nr:glucose-6-phosphate isomerase [Yoonia sp.]
MKRVILMTLAGASLVLVQACENLTAEQRTVVGATGGAAAGLITADILDANKDWRLISALAGAAAGVIVAQNEDTQQCAYARGDGTYIVAPCP